MITLINVIANLGCAWILTLYAHSCYPKWRKYSLGWQVFSKGDNVIIICFYAAIFYAAAIYQVIF